LRAAWRDAAEFRRAAAHPQRFTEGVREDVPFIPMDKYRQATAYRKDLTDVISGCFAVFYGVRRA